MTTRQYDYKTLLASFENATTVESFDKAYEQFCLDGNDHLIGFYDYKGLAVAICAAQDRLELSDGHLRAVDAHVSRFGVVSA